MTTDRIVTLPDPGKTNRERQSDLRRRRRANMVRLTVWLPRTTAEDFRALSDAAGVTHTELLASMIRERRDAQAGQAMML